MRPVILLCLLTLAGCDWLTPPCTKVARAICDQHSQGDACAFVLNIERGDDSSQAVCKKILPAAVALKKDPGSPDAQAGWREARGSLTALGMQTDALKGRIDNKLKQANGFAGHLVDQLEKNSNAAEQTTQQGAQDALDGAKQ